MAVRVGGMYGKKRTFSYPKSYGGGSKAAGKAPGRAQRQLLMDGTAVKSAFALLSAKVTKPMCRIRRRLPEQGERILLEANNQFYDRERLGQTQ